MERPAHRAPERCLVRPRQTHHDSRALAEVGAGLPACIHILHVEERLLQIPPQRHRLSGAVSARGIGPRSRTPARCAPPHMDTGTSRNGDATGEADDPPARQPPRPLHARRSLSHPARHEHARGGNKTKTAPERLLRGCFLLIPDLAPCAAQPANALGKRVWDRFGCSY